jgi:CheY-like chemotaxis protein
MSKTVLYAEDDHIIQKILSKFITKKYPDTHVASNGKEALDIFEKTKIDAIVTDLSMPVMSGFEFIRKVREIDKITPIIVTTAFRDEARQLDDAGVIILFKPIDTKELMRNLDSVLAEQ